MLLNTPFKIANTTVQNRIVIPPMLTFGFGVPGAGVNQRHLNHYTLLGESGAGLLIVESGAVCPPAPESKNGIDLWDDRFIPGLRALAEVCKQGGSVAVVQMAFRGFDGVENKGVTAIPEELLETIPTAFVEAAKRCHQAGFDGVELHGAHGFFLCQLIAQGRADIVKTGIRAIHEACGSSFIVGVRMSCCDPDVATALKNAEDFVQSGADYLSISSGVAPVPKPPEGFPYSDLVYGASKFRGSVNVPVFAVKGVLTPEQAEGILQAGYADGVCVGKGVLADPNWPAKALSGEMAALCMQCKKCRWFEDGFDCPRRKQLGLQV